MKLTSILLGGFLGARFALAHYKFPSLIVDGQVTPEFKYVRFNTNNINPIMDITSLDMRCNEGGLESGPDTETVQVNAGDEIGFTLSNSIGHVGPMVVYMAKSPGDPSNWDADGEVWFKISEWGPSFDGGSIQWPQLDIMEYRFTVPAATPNGNYLVRVEHIAVHNAANSGGCQFFLNCGQVEVTGGGSGNPGPLVAFPGAYSPDDPGIHFNNYHPPPTAYVIPGPPLWSG